MNKYFSLNLSLFLIISSFLSCNNQNNTLEITDLVTVESILKNISEPVIPGFSLNVKDFGAAGDSATNDKLAFDKAIQALNEKGGGKLIVPMGNYIPVSYTHLRA